MERDSGRKQHSSLERGHVPGKLDSFQAYSKGLGSRMTEDDFLSQTCPPGETGRYIRHQSSKDQRTKEPRYPSMHQTGRDEDLISNASVESQLQAKTLAPKKPESKKLKKTQEESGKMSYLIQEQLKLEKELKELQKIREQLVPPLDLRELNTNYVDNSAAARYNEQYLNHKPFSSSCTSAITQKKKSPNLKDLKLSPKSSGHLISGPAHPKTRPELTSDDSVDREVEGLLSEVLFSRDSDDDTSPLKRDYLSPEIGAQILHGSGTQQSSPGFTVNGYHNEVHEPYITNGYNESYSTTPQNTSQFVSAHKNQTVVPGVPQDKVGQFCLLKKQEMYWMNRVRHQRQILAQPLDTVVRQEVEEQYFYAQEELCRIEKAIADLFQHLTPSDIQWLMKNGMGPLVPEYNRSPYNLHTLQPDDHASPMRFHNQLDQRFLLQQQQQHAPYPTAPGTAFNGLNVPERFGYQPTLSQPQYGTSVSPLYVQATGSVFPGYQNTTTNCEDASRQFQTNSNTSNSTFAKPPCTDKETQTLDGAAVPNGVTRLNHSLETPERAIPIKEPRDQSVRVPKMGRHRVDQGNSTKQLQEPGNSELRIEADDLQVYPTVNASLVEGAAPVTHIVPRQQKPNTSIELAREKTVNEEVPSKVHGRQKAAAVKQPSFDDGEVVKLKEKLEEEQKELRDSLKREQMKFLEEQRRLLEEEERQNEWMAKQESQRRMRDSLTKETKIRHEEGTVNQVNP